jgi:hypothetical protein
MRRLKELALRSHRSLPLQIMQRMGTQRDDQGNAG